MKVFNLSPQRSGTKSFHALCLKNNLLSAHYPGPYLDDRAGATVPTLDADQLWHICADYYAAADVFSDFPTPLVYKQALRAYPDAKFVLIRRDVDAWVRSVRTLTTDRDLSWLERFFYHSTIHSTFGGKGLEPYTDTELKTAYEEFYSKVLATLILHGASFFVGWLESPNLGSKLANFLDLEFAEPMEHLY